MKWYFMVFKRYANFKSRARRKEFWIFSLFNIIFYMALVALDAFLKGDFNDKVDFSESLPDINLVVFYMLIVLIPSLAVTVRRLHDVGKSGWILLVFIVLIPVNMFIKVMQVSGEAGGGTLFLALIAAIISIYLLVLLAKDSMDGDNKYGLNPKEIKAN